MILQKKRDLLSSFFDFLVIFVFQIYPFLINNPPLLIFYSLIINDNISLILGDNFFYGQSLSEKLKKSSKLKKGATIFVYPVKNPNRFGVATLKGNRIINLIEN